VISHGRRKILCCHVTRNPTALWIVQQMREAWPYGSVTLADTPDLVAVYFQMPLVFVTDLKI